MTVLPAPGSIRTAIVLYYSPAGRDHLETVLRGQGVGAYSIAGRAPHALEEIRRHPAKVVIVDRDPDDISVRQAVRQVGRALPDSLVVMAGIGRPSAEVYREGRQVGVEESVEAALRCYSDLIDSHVAG